MARANKRLAEAQARAEAMIDEALAGAARIAEEARREGYQAGLAASEAALARALEELDQARRGFEAAALAEARRQVAEALAAAMPELALLVASVARRVVDRELKTDPDTIDGLLRRALEPVREAGQARVRLAPPDLEWLLANPQRLQALASGMEIDWSADRSLAPGDVVVESPQGDVDGRLERQFERLARAMLRRVGSTLGAAPETAEGGGGESA